MPSEIAFNWRPGTLEWLLILEFVVLLTMLGFRYVAELLGRTAPTDPFVIFYRVFWVALRHPRRYPVPVNYQPTLPKAKKTPAVGDEDANLTGLTDEELEAIMGGLGDGNADSAGPPTSTATPTGKPTPTADTGDEEDGLGGTLQSTLTVQVVTGPVPQVLGCQRGTVIVQVNVPPEDGRANAIAIRQVCNILRLQPHQVAILEGHTKPDKLLRLSGLSAAVLAQRLEHLDTSCAPASDRASDDGDDELMFRE